MRDLTFSHSRPRGFSLVELLVVLALMSILIALIAPAFNSIGQSNRMTSAAQILIAELNRARQEAISKNRAVEVRFYNVPPRDQPTSSSRETRVLQTIVLDESAGLGPGSKRNKLSYFPPGVRISSSSTLTEGLPDDPAQKEKLPSYNDLECSYVKFWFRPNGGVWFDPGSGNPLPAAVNWTLVGETDTAIPPTNFATIQLDTRTGRVRLFRP